MAEANGHGGAREGAGRKPKAEEIALIERLSPLDDLAFSVLKQGLESGDQSSLKLFMAYRFGQPKQTIDASLSGELLVNWHEEKTYEK